MAHRGETLHKDVSCIADLKRMGSSRLPTMVRDYYNEGAMDLITLHENEAAFDRYKIRPRILRNVDHIDMSTEILGSKVSLPFGFSPTASQKLAHPDGELATSSAAAKFGICMGLSSYSNHSLEDVAAKGLGNPYVMQMCVLRDRGLTLQLLERAEKAGYKALFLSVDVPVLGKRLNEYRNNYQLPDDMSWPNILSWGSDTSNRTDYVCTPEDVELALQYGVDGIVVSNHGGRQLDGIPATLDALRECAPIAKGRLPIAIDGGIRRGSDIFKALALGADYCFIGRIAIWGLAYNGQEGVELAIRILRQELAITMALAGCRSIKEIRQEYLSILHPDGKLSKL
ncbi:S-2-hydroxy-acid oxidase [Aspergillus sclerotialis]|uniref:S-2-hydroxy-acid oxidase n=1 Tax=Aspergillus sclerotialis TaxID=2070753 RepID=A0A3A2ZET4_9EURO|nr:S-2-hydroxy-acid oxidase [Aspergillus sclerotialis]